MTKNLKNALHRISLASQNSMSSKEECGRIAREALASEPKTNDEIEEQAKEIARLRAALADIARGDYSDPLCMKTPEQRAREALAPKKEKP